MNHEFSDARWIRSRYCSTDGCVEVTHLPGGVVAIRDSKDVTKAPHVFDQQEWQAFIAGVRSGDFDR